ncbi:hypothetical protein PRZ48_003896 [Zasmidium cellare]|uniref:Xylanolytic transcriptional activator regulatory domain-containing protein n=1 Tax=Zasmidium cellare TaxID=395010 RepID=A0ABR0EXP7_ZASCE|nr:hypothetical protein PRZ48_003896 [Zasmidium cellare]
MPRSQDQDVDLTEGTPQSLPVVAPAQSAQPASIAGSTTKRRADVAGLDSPGTPIEHGKRIARDLGLVSLNVSNSRTHYLGASSGQFFVDLLQDDRETHNQVAGEDESAESSDVEEGFGVSGRGPPSRGNFAVLKKLQKVLPTQDECNRHVRLFFHHYHPEYPVFHQPTVYSLVAALYTSLHVPSADSLGPHGWPVDIAPFDYNGEAPDKDGRSMIATSPTTAAAQLFFILATAAHLQNHKHRFGSDPRPYEELAVQLMSRSLGDVSLESVQLIVLSILHGFISGKSGNPWVFLHLGMAYAVDLGLHRASQDSTRFSSEHIQMRRRVFFCLYTLDR